jgi:hypothetical protein
MLRFLLLLLVLAGGFLFASHGQSAALTFLAVLPAASVAIVFRSTPRDGREA